MRMSFYFSHLSSNTKVRLHSDFTYLIQSSKHRGDTVLSMNNFHTHFFLININWIFFPHADSCNSEANDENLHQSSLCKLVVFIAFTEFLGILYNIQTKVKWLLYWLYFLMVYLFIWFDWLFHTIYHFSLSVDNNVIK